MNRSPAAASAHQIPQALHPYFQEYDIAALDFTQDASLIIQRTFEFGTWEDARWLFSIYDIERIRSFLRRYGERSLNPLVFHYWRKLLRIRRWQRSPFPTPKGELWPF